MSHVLEVLENTRNAIKVKIMFSRPQKCVGKVSHTVGDMSKVFCRSSTCVGKVSQNLKCFKVHKNVSSVASTESVSKHIKLFRKVVSKYTNGVGEVS